MEIEYRVQGNYAQGWEDVYVTNDKLEAVRTCNDYQFNDRDTAYRVRGVRI